MPLVQTGRCVEAQSFPWSVVQVVDDVVALGLRDQAHARALGQVLSHQAVEAFVALSFPRVVRRGEVDLHWEALFEQSVVMELGAVVEGDRLEQPAVLSERAGRRTRDLVLGARLELHHDRVSGLANVGKRLIQSGASSDGARAEAGETSGYRIVDVGLRAVGEQHLA